MDFYTDTAHTLLASINALRPMPEFVKKAHVIDKGSIPDRLFALPEKRAFSVADPSSVYLSFGYWLFNQNKLEKSASDRVKEKLLKMAAFYEILPDIFNLAKAYTTAKEKIYEKRAESLYGIPEKKAFPLFNRCHINLAQECFPKVERDYNIYERVKIAQAIKNRAEEESIPVTQIIIKYASLPKKDCNESLAMVNLAARALETNRIQNQRFFNKLAHMIPGNLAGNTENMVKLAELIEELDEGNGVKHSLSPIDTIWNCAKKAQDNFIKIGPKEYNVTSLSNLPQTFWQESLGDDFVSQVMSGNGINPQKLIEVLSTLPLPEQNILSMMLDQNV